eukprot:gene13422-13550_t
MDSGRSHQQHAVLAYVQQLEEHRKRCELTGQYAEAGAAAVRISELKAARASELRAQLLAAQQAELQILQSRYQQETLLFDQHWQDQVTAYEADIAHQLIALKGQQQEQLALLATAWETQRPSKPQHSAQYLNHRKIEEALVKQGQYRKAHEVKVAADALYMTEADNTNTNWESELEIKKNKLLSKQQVALEVQLQRAARCRSELELKRLDELQKRHNRFRCMVQELDSLHHQEVLHLEGRLEGQFMAGRYQPLQDSSSKRKRELLGIQGSRAAVKLIFGGICNIKVTFQSGASIWVPAQPQQHQLRGLRYDATGTPQQLQQLAAQLLSQCWLSFSAADVDDKQWCYLNEQDVSFGPFSARQLQKFNSSGVWKADFPICHKPSSIWLPVWLVLRLMGLPAIQKHPTHTSKALALSAGLAEGPPAAATASAKQCRPHELNSFGANSSSVQGDGGRNSSTRIVQLSNAQEPAGSHKRRRQRSPQPPAECAATLGPGAATDGGGSDDTDAEMTDVDQQVMQQIARLRQDEKYVNALNKAMAMDWSSDDQEGLNSSHTQQQQLVDPSAAGEDIPQVAAAARAALRHLQAAMAPGSACRSMYQAQTIQEFRAAAREQDFGVPDKSLSADDRILQATLSRRAKLHYWQQQHAVGCACEVLLLTNDTAFRLKAQANGVPVASLWELTKLPGQRSQMLLDRLLQLSGIAADSRSRSNTNAQPTSFSPATATTAGKLPSRHLPCRVTRLLQQEYEELWLDVVCRKPPWNDNAFLHVLSKHWRSTLQEHLTASAKSKCRELEAAVAQLLVLSKQLKHPQPNQLPSPRLHGQVVAHVVKLLQAFGAHGAAEEVAAAGESMAGAGAAGGGASGAGSFKASKALCVAPEDAAAGANVASELLVTHAELYAADAAEWLAGRQPGSAAAGDMLQQFKLAAQVLQGWPVLA